MSHKIEELEKEIIRLKKINSALMKRVEARLSDQKNAFSMFEGNILLEKQVKERTRLLAKTSEELLEEKGKLSQLIKALPGDVVLFDQAFNVIKRVKTRFSDHLYRFSDKNNEKVSFSKDFHGALESVVLEKISLDSSTSFEYLLKRDDNLELFFYCGISLLSGGEYLLYIQEDTENYKQKQLIRDQELQLIQASKLSSLGEMAGGVAHEINTPLGAIILSADRLRKLCEDDSIDKEKSLRYVNMISQTADRVAKIVKSLRQVSRDASEDEFEPCLLSDIIEDAVGLCREKFNSHGIQFIIQPFDDVSIHAKRIQLSQILLNLLNNSFYVARTHQQGWIKVHCSSESGKVKIQVIDSGVGIEKSVLEKIFQPFFTTKDVGEGTGLGMSVSQQIARDHGGELEYSLVNGHTSFSFYVRKADELLMTS